MLHLSRLIILATNLKRFCLQLHHLNTLFVYRLTYLAYSLITARTILGSLITLYENTTPNSTGIVTGFIH